ncbi:MAG: putative DNA binding domain-containing protein [Spirochaetales bacterium]|nr:putative DNA binding domain-containing protein [Spirochaetales bacterium]
MIEGVNVEFKELDRDTGMLPSSTAKELVAFANTEGGDLYIGVGDDGSIIGVDNPDIVMNRLSNLIHDRILPDLMPFIQIRSLEMEGKNIIKVSVSIGSERPYYLKKEGLRPNGVFVRRGSACFPLSDTGIKEMITDTYGKSFEDCRSQIQELTFGYFEKELNKRGMEFGAVQMKNLRMIGEDGLYTNLALLLSDQCKHTIKVAIFQGRDGSVFRARREFSGSVLQQLNETYDFLDIQNNLKASFSGLVRKDSRDYPEVSIREALLNCIIHRDYLFPGSTIINIYEDHIEFISLGGLVRGLSLEAIYLGASQSRNPNLAAVFLRLGLVEGYGTGIRKILGLYDGFSSPPRFRTAEGVFSVTLFNENERTSTSYGYEISERRAQYGPNNVPRETLMKSILEFAGSIEFITRKDVQDKFDVGSTKAFLCLKKLCDDGKLIQHNMGRQTTYSLNRF